MSQLFDSLDPSPFFEQDLDRNAEEYIIDSVKEFHSAADWELVIHLDQAPGPPEERSSVETAIGIHFARRSRLLKRDLRRLMRRGVISLGIGLAFLTASFIIAELLGRVIGDSHYRTLLREGFLIFGWVAVWKPLEIFLYDWWPILGQRRMHDRLSRIKVRIICSGSGPRRPTRELRGSGPEAPPKNERQNLT